MRYIVAVIRSCAGAATRSSADYTIMSHQVWMVTIVVTLPETLPCVLRGGNGTDGQGQFLTRMLA